MLRSILFLALLSGAAAAQAETNVCTTITSLPYVINTPGQYCLTSNLTVAESDAPAWAITIQAPDVTLDCNDHSITGPAPIAALENNNMQGIGLTGVPRTTVRNCRVFGFDNAISVGITPGAPRPSDVLIEDNYISSTKMALVGNGSGSVRILRNTVFKALGGGIQIAVRDGIGQVRDNYVSNSGDPNVPEAWGTAYTFTATSEVVANRPRTWIFASGNTAAEIVSPPTATGGNEPAIFAFGNVVFEDNVILAPSDPAKQGVVVSAIYAGPSVNCHGNVIIGYGGEANNPPCAAANNRIY